MSKYALSRRTVLRGLSRGALVAVGLPALEAMLDANGTAHADGSPIPRRFGLWFFGDGVKKYRWVPLVGGKIAEAPGTWRGADWQLNEELKALADVKPWLTVVFNTRLKIGGHHQGASMLTTGTAPFYTSMSPPSSTPRGPSVDHLVAREIGALDPIPSMQLGLCNNVSVGEGPTLYAISHTGQNAPVRPLWEPQRVWNKLFGADFMPVPGAAPGGDPQRTLRAELRRSLLDVVREDAASIRGRLGAADQRRLDQHLEGLRQIEARLAAAATAAAPVGAGCRAPKGTDLPAKGGGNDEAALLANNELHAQLLAMALVCGRTKVFSFMHSGSVDNTVFKWFGAPTGHHGMTHNEKRDTLDRDLDQPIVQKSNAWKLACLGKLLRVFKDTPEGAGNLLDSCGILVATDVSQGHDHSGSAMPLLLAGRAGGALKGDTFYYSPGEHSLQLHVTLFKALGLKLDSFGAGSYLETKPLPGLV
jgi:hypothetical protein